MRIEFKIHHELTKDEREIRTAVFCVEQGFSIDLEFDEIDAKATHILLYIDGKIAGCCRVFFDEKKQRFTLGRLVINKNFRGLGLGKLLIEKGEEVIREKKGSSLWLHAQKRATGFYETCGYQMTEEWEPDEGYPHIWMFKNL